MTTDRVCISCLRRLVEDSIRCARCGKGPFCEKHVVERMGAGLLCFDCVEDDELEERRKQGRTKP